MVDKPSEELPEVQHMAIPRSGLAAYMETKLGVKAGGNKPARELSDQALQWQAYGNHIMGQFDDSARIERKFHEENTAHIPADRCPAFPDYAIVTIRGSTITVSNTAALLSTYRGWTTSRVDGFVAFSDGEANRVFDPKKLLDSNSGPGHKKLPPEAIMSSGPEVKITPLDRTGNPVLVDGRPIVENVKYTTYTPVQQLVIGDMGKDRIVVVPSETVRSFYNSETKEFQPTSPVARASGAKLSC
jgi:hypothetical protein